MILPPAGYSRSIALRRSGILGSCLLEQLSSSSHGAACDVSLLAQEVVRFLSGVVQGVDREWWLQLLDILRLLRPFKEHLARERGILLPALERLNREYERHQFMLSDLDIPNALCAAFPPDSSTLFKLPKDLENLHQPQLQRIHLWELPHYVGGVGAELANSESLWRCSRGETSLALRTDLRVELCPDTDLQSSRGDPVVPHPCRERGKSRDSMGHAIEGYEAAELMVKYRHLGKVIFLYLNRVLGIHSCQYDLRVCPLAHVHPEHFVFSPFGILHVNPLNGSEVQELGAWHREAVLCRALRKIPFYRDFLISRVFRRWRTIVKRIWILRKQDILNKTLVLTVPHYTASLQHLYRLLQELAQVPWLPLQPSCSYTVDQLEMSLLHLRSEAKSHLHNFLTLVSRILELVREDTYIMVKTTQKDLEKSPEKTTRKRSHQAESWLHRLGNLASLFGHMVCQNLCSLLQQNICTFVYDVIQLFQYRRDTLHCTALLHYYSSIIRYSSLYITTTVIANNLFFTQTVPQTGKSFLRVSLEFSDHGELVLCPSAQQIQQNIDQALAAVLDSVLEVTDIFVLNQPKPSSFSAMMDPPAEHGSPLHSLLRREQLRKVIPAPAPPSAESINIERNKELSVQGQLLRANYLPLNFHSLHYMLNSDHSIQQARETLRRLLEASLMEVMQFCEENSWLHEIHHYVQSWSSQVLEKLSASSAGEYEDLVLKLQHWEQRVHGVRECITTPLLEVCCAAIHTKTGPGLDSIIQDILGLLTSEVAFRSQGLIEELSQVLEIFKAVSADSPSFSKCAHKVDEYTKKREELEERIKYVNSLSDIIRMYYRQPTAEEQNVKRKLIDTWDRFHHYLRIAAEFLNGHLSSMSTVLEQSFLRCYREAEDLIAAASSPMFLDPSQNVALRLRDLGTLRQNLHSRLVQLRDFSHSRQVLQGKTFDISDIAVGEQQIQARQDSWKLLSRCREQIKAWKLSPFVKVNIDQMREKLQHWEKSLQDLGLLLPQGDPILESVSGSLQDFSQHLPLLQSLLNPALTHKHWASIFTVMGKTFGGLETLTLLDLLSCPLLNHQEQLQKVTLRAQAEFSTVQRFKKIQTFWQEKEFRLVRFFLCVYSQDPSPDQSKRPPSGRFREPDKGYCTQDSGTVLLSDTQSLCSLIDDSIMSLKMMSASLLPAGDIRDEISGWIHNLQYLANTVDLWITFQEKWVFLTKAQHELETPIPSAEMITQLQSIDLNHRSFLDVTVQDPLVLSILKPNKKRGRHFYGEALCASFQRGTSILENIIANMGDVLYSSRCVFPRLFFLSDHDLLGILAASPEPSERLPCALLCFPRLTNVLFQAQSPNTSSFPLFSSQALTIGVMGNYEETLSLRSPILWNPKIISWLVEIEQRLQESVKYQLELCLSERRAGGLSHLIHKENASQYVESGTQFPWQCLAVAEEVLWCEDMEKFLLTEQKLSLREKNKLKIEFLVQRLRELEQGLHRDRIFLSAWITLAVLQRDRMLSLLDAGIQTLDSFTWAKMMKYRAQPPSSLQDLRISRHEDLSETEEMFGTEGHTLPSSCPCYVDVLGYQLPYEYEYVGLDMNIIDTALSERTTIGLILALENYQCGTVIGQDEGFRTQTVMALGSALGRQVVVLKCWTGINLSRLTLHLHGALQGGAWLLLDNAHQLKSNVQVSLGQLLIEIQSSCKALTKERQSCECVGSVSDPVDRQNNLLGKFQFEERTVLVMQSYGCFVTLPHLNSSCTVPCNLRLLLRPVSLCSPDLRTAAELALLSAGFQQHFYLAKKISCFFQLAQESGAVTAASTLSLLKTVIQRAISFLKTSLADGNGKPFDAVHRESVRMPRETDHQLRDVLDNSTSTMHASLQEEESILSALSTSSLWSGLSVSESTHLKDILRGVFLVYTSPLPSDEHDTALWNSINLHLHESDLEVHTELGNNVLQLFHAIQQSRGILLTGPAGSGKTTCWKVLHRALNHQVGNVESIGAEGALNNCYNHTYQPVHIVQLFPNTLSPTEFLGGGTDGKGGGIFSNILQRAAREPAAIKWLILDGSAASQWIEPISCLFGPHPVLTLADGQRLHLTDSVKLIFEMPDISAISPAMSTLCSVVHCSGHETWRTILRAFMSNLYVKYNITRSTEHQLRTVSENLIPHTLCFLEQHCTLTLHPHSTQTAHGVHEVSTFCTILQALMDQHLLRDSFQAISETPRGLQELPKHTKFNNESRAMVQKAEDPGTQVTETSGFPHMDQDVPSNHYSQAQTYLIYSFIWGFGGHLHPKHRGEFDLCLRKSLSHFAVEVQIPADTSVFDVTPSPDGITLAPCLGAVLPQYESPLYAARCIALSGHPVLLVGSPSSGKTTLAQSVIPHGATSLRIPVSALLQAAHLRQELKIQHKTPDPVGLTRVKVHHVRHLFFLDDLHEASFDPEISAHPALEVIRQMVSDPASVPSHTFLATVSPPEDGFKCLCPRLSRLFSVLVLAPFNSDILLSLFSPHFMVWMKKSLPVQQPQEFGKALALASITLYHKVTQTLPPKYCFSLHHMHRLLQSMTFLCPSPGTHLSTLPNPSVPDAVVTRCGIVRLWMHEVMRTFGDGLETQQETEIFKGLLQDCVMRTFCSQTLSENTEGDDDTNSLLKNAEKPPSRNEDEEQQSDFQTVQINKETHLIINEAMTTENDYVFPTSGSSFLPKEYQLTAELLLNDQHLHELNFCHDYSPGLNGKCEALIYKERPINTLNIVQAHDLKLSPVDLQHITRLTRVLLLPRGHIVLLSQHPGTGKKSLARLAARITQCTLLEISGKETEEERHTLIREACWKAGVLGSAAALLVGDGTPPSALQEMESLVREGTFPGLYSAEEEQTLLQTMMQMEKGLHKNSSNRSLRERFHVQVRNNLHVIVVQSSKLLSPQLYRFFYIDVYHPWDFSSLHHVAEKLVDQAENPLCGSEISRISLPRVMSLIHLLAQSYCHRMWPLLPLTTPGAFISFINIYLKYSSELRDRIEKEIGRLQRAVSRMEEVFVERELCTRGTETLSQCLLQAEQETESWRKKHKEIREAEDRLREQCEELERVRDNVKGQVNTLHCQRHLSLEQACLQWAEVQKQLKLSDIEEIRSYRSPPPAVIMVTDVLCTVFGREPGWENAKLLMGQENFYQDLQFYDGHTMSNSVFTSLTKAVRGPEFNAHSLRLVSSAVASLCEWLCGLRHYCRILRNLDKGKCLLSKVEAQYLQVAEKISKQQLQKENLKVLRDQSSHNLQKASSKEEDVGRQLHEVQSRQKVAQEYENMGKPHASIWNAALKTLHQRLLSVHTDALLISASITYLGCLPWSRCMVLLDKWQSLCQGAEVSLDTDDVREAVESPSRDWNGPGHLLEILITHAERMEWHRQSLPVNTEAQTRAALFRASGHYSLYRPTLILDPDLMAEKMLWALLERGTVAPTGLSEMHNIETQRDSAQQRALKVHQELHVIDASEMAFSQSLSAAAREGAWVLITNVEKNLSCMNIIHSLHSQFDLTKSSQSQRPSHHGDVTLTQENDRSMSFHLYFSTHLSLSAFVEEVGPSVLKYVNVMDASLGPAGLEEELVQEILVFKDRRLQEERRRMCGSTLQLKEDIQRAQDTLLDYISSDTSPLLQNNDFLNRMSLYEETLHFLEESLCNVEILQQRTLENMAPYVSAAQQCLFLYSRLQEVSRLSPQYHFPAGSILDWARRALHTHTEMGLQVEKVLSRAILSHVLPSLTEEHRQILRVLMAVGQSPALEWFSFLGLLHKSVQDTSSSCIQRPQWVGCQAWEELGRLEKLSAFRGIRSSLSGQARQWQEYFSLRSTVIGPVPCSNFSNLTLFQTAILWRILKPQQLGLVLTHFTSCILGPEPTDRWKEEADIMTLHSPVLFLLPQAGQSPPAYYPMYHVLHMARKKSKEVKVITWKESISETDVRDTLVTSQQEGYWLLLNWHPKLADVLKNGVDPATVNPEFHLYIIVQEETFDTVPVCVRRTSRPAPCMLRSNVRNVLLQSCLEAAEKVGTKLQNTLSLKLLILHSILLLRQEYSGYIQESTYSWSDEDLALALHALERVMSVSHDWEEGLLYLTGVVIYGGHILEDGDAQSVTAVVQQCLQDSPRPQGSRGLSNLLSSLVVCSPTGSWMDSVQWALQKISSIRDPAALGLSEGLQNTTIEVYGQKILSNLLLTQDIWTSEINKEVNFRFSSQGDQNEYLQCATPDYEDFQKRSSSSSPGIGISENTLSQCLALLVELRNVTQQRDLEIKDGLQEDQHLAQPERRDILTTDCLKEDTSQNVEEQKATTVERQKGADATKKPKRSTRTQDVMDGHSQKLPTLKKHQPSLSFLLEEWDLLCGLIKQAIQELKDIGSPCHCWRCQEIRKTLSEGYVPTSWNVYSLSFPVSPLAWVQGLQVRVKLLSTYISESSPFNITYNLSVFRHPTRLLHSLLQERGLKDHKEVEMYSLHLQVSDRTAPPEGHVGIAVTGIHLKHALWDTRQALLQETLSPKLCTLPVVSISAVPDEAMCRRPVTSHYLCPVYSFEAPEGHSQHQVPPVLFLPLPTNIPPSVWSQRRVHAVSLL
ncbi:dynein heavy chain domain-containing protein 1 [Mixophyes fleayi]|uniref:dynein heavy chain domain-containing protein 1 n=1 Tax=Mixophyes fleayi TaxID=3061075 RepID=UPI003F4DF61F